MSEANLQVAGVRRGLTQHEVTLASQDLGPSRAKNAPEQRLMIAILHDALECLEENRFATTSRQRRLYHEARRWFLATGTEWPFSFECICGVLDIDAPSVRRRLLLRAVAQRAKQIVEPLTIVPAARDVAEALDERTCR